LAQIWRWHVNDPGPKRGPFGKFDKKRIGNFWRQFTDGTQFSTQKSRGKAGSHRGIDRYSRPICRAQMHLGIQLDFHSPPSTRDAKHRHPPKQNGNRSRRLPFACRAQIDDRGKNRIKEGGIRHLALLLVLVNPGGDHDKINPGFASSAVRPPQPCAKLCKGWQAVLSSKPQATWLCHTSQKWSQLASITSLPER
jgi:hypothetical protein